VRPDGSAAMVKAKPGQSESFQWMETPTGELVLMSLRTNRYLRVNKSNGRVVADSPGPQPDGQDGVRFVWERTR
jgi:outer membrane biogenesis lipoprotein LolB